MCIFYFKAHSCYNNSLRKNLCAVPGYKQSSICRLCSDCFKICPSSLQNKGLWALPPRVSTKEVSVSQGVSNWQLYVFIHFTFSHIL